MPKNVIKSSVLQLEVRVISHATYSDGDSIVMEYVHYLNTNTKRYVVRDKEGFVKAYASKCAASKHFATLIQLTLFNE